MENTSILEGSIFKSILKLALPLIFANILQTAYQLIDTFWVGRLGTDAVAAVSISFPVIFLIISLGSGLGMAGSILIAQNKGRNNLKEIDNIASQTLSLVLLVSTFLSIIGYFLSPLFVKLMGAEPQIYQSSVYYMEISFLGTVFVFTFMVFQSLLRGVGEVRLPVFIVLATVLLNLVLDPLFIFGYGAIPAFGVAGAAVATIATQSIATLIGIYVLFRGRHGVKVRLKSMKLELKKVKQIIKLGFPASIEHSSRAIGMLVMTLLVASFGTLTIAAYGIGGRILSFIIIPAIGLSMASSTLVGQHLGANKLDRIDKIIRQTTIIGFLSLTFIGVLVFIFAKAISAAFIPGEIETIESSARFIKIMALTFGFIGIQMAQNGAFRGSGNTNISMLLTLISVWVLQFPIAYVLSKHTGLAEIGIWWAFPISNIIAALITMLWIKKGKWKDKKLV